MKRLMRDGAPWILVLALVGCDGGAMTDDAGPGGDAAPDDGAVTMSDGGDDPDAGETDAGPTATCGDGTVEVGESCDDGNTDDGDYCSADCQTVTGACGDATLQKTEVCDDGNAADGDYCASDCQTQDLPGSESHALHTRRRAPAISCAPARPSNPLRAGRPHCVRPHGQILPHARRGQHHVALP